jgi:hypothetical protein
MPVINDHFWLIFLQEQQVLAPVVEPPAQVAPPVLPRNSAPTRPPSGGTGDEVWVRLNNASYAEGLSRQFKFIVMLPGVVKGFASNCIA